MEYTTHYDVGDRKRDDGINEDSVAIDVFEQGHRDGYRGVVHHREQADDARDQPDETGEEATESEASDSSETGESASDEGSEPADDGESRDERPATRSVAAFALADGAGGHAAGDVASYIATTVVCEHLAPVAIRAARGDADAFGVPADATLPDVPRAADLESAVAEAVEAAHRDVLRYARENDTKAYTTVVAGVCVDGQVHYGWVGDSRAYLVNEARESIELLTKDHAVVERMQDRGELDGVEARVHPRGHEITRAVGGTGRSDPENATLDVDTNTVPMYGEDVLLVTSDGLIDAQTDATALYDRYVRSGRSDDAADEVLGEVVTKGEIRAHVLGAESLDEAARGLIDLGNSRGGKDNLSVLCLRDSTLPTTPSDRPLGRAIEPEDALEDRSTVIIE